MTRLNVRCCCQPTKILGTMEVPSPIAERGGFFKIFSRPKWLTDGYFSSEPDNIQTVEVRCLILRGFSDDVRRYEAKPMPLDTEMAVYAEERPIEFWRTLPGFRESDEV